MAVSASTFLGFGGGYFAISLARLAHCHALSVSASEVDYPRYRRGGWPIGSGAVEGACKRLVKERFGITGARWRRQDLPHVLALRTAQFNGGWKLLWRTAA